MTKLMRVFGLAAMLAASQSPAVAQADLEEWRCYYTVATGPGAGYNDEGVLRIVDKDLRAYWAYRRHTNPMKPELGRVKEERISNYTIISNDKDSLIVVKPADKPSSKEESGIGMYVMVLDKSDGRLRSSQVVIEQSFDTSVGRCEKK